MASSTAVKFPGATGVTSFALHRAAGYLDLHRMLKCCTKTQYDIKTVIGCVWRDVERQLEKLPAAMQDKASDLLAKTKRPPGDAKAEG